MHLRMFLVTILFHSSVNIAYETLNLDTLIREPGNGRLGTRPLLFDISLISHLLANPPPGREKS
jgi:hypothetical protein